MSANGTSDLSITSVEAREIIFPALRSWPPAVSDLDDVPTDATEIRLVSGAKNLRKLHKCTRLKALLCFAINDEALESICHCPSLESLYIDNLKTGNLDRLGLLRNLSALSLDSCSKITSLAFLTHLPTLAGLAIIHFKNVHDLTPLAEMTSLRSLAVAGSIWTRMTVASFAPLERLRNLEFLHLTNIKAEDDSLEPLATLTRLKQLDIANFYPMSEFARLSQKLPSTACAWFRPFVAMPSVNCKKCGRAAVMLTGKRQPSLCTGCDVAKLDRHVKQWNHSIGAL